MKIRQLRTPCSVVPGDTLRVFSTFRSVEMNVDLANRGPASVAISRDDAIRLALWLLDVCEVDVHTRECWDYAAKTNRQSGVWHCIAPCARLRRGETTPSEYESEVVK